MLEPKDKAVNLENYKVGYEKTSDEIKDVKESLQKLADAEDGTITAQLKDDLSRALQAVTIINNDTGKAYQGAIKVIDGKPVFDYIEVPVAD